MARPRKDSADRLRALLRSRCSAEELAQVRVRAGGAGLTVSEYVRRAALRGQVVVRQERGPDLVVAGELRRIGNNINQAMVLAHTQGEIPVELQRLWAKLELVLDRIISGE
jgi:hypothetical protein